MIWQKSEAMIRANLPFSQAVTNHKPLQAGGPHSSAHQISHSWRFLFRQYGRWRHIYAWRCFWEFGSADWERTECYVLFGVAEDHDSNPIKMGLGKLKKRGVKILSVNPVQTGYAAVSDDWYGITPGMDGLFILSVIRELMISGKIDVPYLTRYTNAPYLVIQNEGAADHGLFWRDGDGNTQIIDRATGKPVHRTQKHHT